MSVRLSLAITLLLAVGVVACSSVVPPSLRQKEVRAFGDGSIYSGGTVLDMAGADLGQPVEIAHIEIWIITDGKYALWDNALRISLGTAARAVGQ